MTLSLRADIATYTDQNKGFDAESKVLDPETISGKYNHDFTNDAIPDSEALDKFDSPSSKAERAAAKAQIKAEKEGIKNYKFFTEQEIKKVYDSVDKIYPYDEIEATKYRDDGRPSKEMLKKFRNARLKAQIMMAYTMGLRASELAEVDKPEYAFKWKNIDIEEGTAKVTGKGNKTRKIVIPPSALLHMREWYDIAEKVARGFPDGPDFRNSQFVFPSFDQYGNLNIDRPMTGDVFAGELKRLSEASGIDPRRLRPHVLRHSYATHLYMHGVSIEVISKLLGHARLDTTEIYRHISEEFQQRIASPVIRGLDPSGLTTTEVQAPKGIMGEGSSKDFNGILNSLEPEQRSSLQDVMHAYRDGVNDPNKSRVWLLSEFERLGYGENTVNILDQEAMRLRQGQIPGAIEGGPSAAQQASSNIHRALDDSPLNNDMEAKIAADRLNATLPQTYDDRSVLKKGEIGKNFDVKVTDEGARKILDIAKAENINIAQAYDRLVTSIQTTHYRLGDFEARIKFEAYINKLFPQGIGIPGQRVLFDPPGMPKGMIADSYEHHAIAQYLFDNGYIEDGDPVRTTKGERAGLLKYAQETGVVNKDGSIKGSGDERVSGHVGNQIKTMFSRGGEYYWSSFDVDRNTGEKIYIPLMDKTGTRPARVYPYLMPSLSGYKITDAEAKIKPGVLPAWMTQVPSPEQAKFFADMNEYDRLKAARNRMKGQANLASSLNIVEARMGEIRGEYAFVPLNIDGVPTKFPEFIPGLVDAPSKILELANSFDPENSTENARLADNAATQQANTPDSKKVVLVPKGALFDVESRKQNIQEAAKKSSLGKVLDNLNKNSPKAILPIAAGYAAYEISQGKSAMAAIAELFVPMVLESSPAHGPGPFEVERKRQSFALKLERQRTQAFQKKLKQAQTAEIQRRVQSGEIPHPRMGAAGRAVHSIVGGAQELGKDVRSFLGMEDDSVGEVDVAGSPNFTQEEMAEYMSKDLMRAGLTPEGRQRDLQEKQRRILHGNSSFMDQ